MDRLGTSFLRKGDSTIFYDSFWKFDEYWASKNEDSRVTPIENDLKLVVLLQLASALAILKIKSIDYANNWNVSENTWYLLCKSVYIIIEK